MPKVAVITPTCRRDPHIVKRSIESVLRQTHEDWTMTVCSDGAEEPRTKELVEGYRDSRLKYIFTGQKRGGFGGAVRQHVMPLVQGEYYAFLDDDNFLLPRFMSSMLSAVEGHTFAICECLHFGPLHPSVGTPPIVLPGVPLLYQIDTIQVLVERKAMLETGWIQPHHYCADGLTYQELGRKYSYVNVREVLAVHM